MQDPLPTGAQPILRFSEGTLLLEDMPRDALGGLFDGMDARWDGRVPAWRTDALNYRPLSHRLRGACPNLQDFVPQWTRVAFSPSLPAPWPEQAAAISDWHKTRNGVVVMPTGTGKTEVALHLMAQLGESALIVAPIRDLMYQWHRRISAGLNYDAGIIGDSVFDVRPVSVTTYDSAYIHMARLGNRFRLLVFDECHHLPGRLRQDAALMCAAPHRLGLTATLERGDGRHALLDHLIGPTVHRSSIGDARGRTLAEFQVEKVPVHLLPEEQALYDRLSGEIRAFMAAKAREQRGYGWNDLCAESGADPETRRVQRAYHAKKAIENRAAEKLRVVEDIFRLHAGQQAIIFAGSNEMAREVSRRFLIPCVLSHCMKKERADIMDGLKSGAYRAVVANRIFDEGVNLPDIKLGVVIGGDASTRQAKQRLGRLLRKNGDLDARLYEVVVQGTNEEARSRARRKSDAYKGTRHIRRARLARPA